MSSRKFKILQYIEGETSYGAAESVMTLSKALRRAGQDVELAIFEGRPMSEFARSEGIPYHQFGKNKRDLRAALRLAKFLKEGKYDVLHTHLSKATLLGWIAARAAGLPVVSTVHGMNKKWSYMQSTHVVTVSAAAKQHLVDQGMKPDRISVVYNGIDLSQLPSLPSKEELRTQLGLQGQALLLGTVARAHTQKGIDDAIQAMAILKERGVEAKYAVVGDGKHKTMLEDLARKLGVADRVLFAGFQSDIRPWLGAMDIFLFPTKKEAFGISLIEAMEASLPIITTAVGGVPEVVDESCAKFVPPSSPSSLALAIEELIADPEKRREIGEAGRQRLLARFTDQSSAEAMIAVYEKVLCPAS